MCLGVPGKVVAGGEPGAELPMGRVEFGGIVREVCLACTPDVVVGEYVLVHAGFSISKLSEAEADEVFSYLREIDRLNAEPMP
ncbi:MAG: HypC/HybG/HupF family hydrogenase formation chaperone [Polyangiaceae bacterium]|nr:HypC/HybG/HupF family hydrogenase formation chaperone [Polyangiaceae bacterium]